MKIRNPENIEQKVRRKHCVHVPRLYKEAARVLKKVHKGEGLRDVVFKANHPNIRGIYALACKSIKNNQLLESIMKKTGLLNDKFDPDLAKILVTELLWGKKSITGDSKPVQITLQYEKALRKAAKEASIPVLTEEKPLRYIRINTLLNNVDNTISRLLNDGWQLVDTPENYEAFLECASILEADQCMRDYHFDDVLVFPPKCNMHEYELVNNGSLLLQDKASCLPALLLDPKPGSIVLDMCAAPGMKTTHLANLMENKGTLFAVDKDPKRFEIMKDMIKKNCKRHNCVTMKLADSTHLTSEDCPGVQYILIDPSCSGTGMASRIDDQHAVEIHSKRIKKLGHFQEQLLVQAMTAFPDVKRIVYSTCSLLEEENEKVLEKALARVKSFQVVPPQLKKPWICRGSIKYAFGSNCLVADKNKDRTNGFFVAVLERIPEMSPLVEAKSKKRNYVMNVQNTDSDERDVSKKRKKATKMKQMEVSSHNDNPKADGWEAPKKKKKAKNIKQIEVSSHDGNPSAEDDV